MKVVAAMGMLVVLAVATIGAVRLTTSRDGETTQAADMRTAVVEQGALAAGMRLTGTLTRGQVTPLSGTGDGVLTALPAPGAQVAAGEVLYEVDGRPVFLLSGTAPLWRSLGLGDTGKDVLALKVALAALGHDVGDVSTDVFDAATSNAVAALYASVGQAPPTETTDGAKAITEAQAAIDAAQRSVVAARKALADAGAAPVALVVAQADAAVAEAAAALDEANAAGTGAALAQAQLDAAKTARAALDAAPDVTAQRQAVDDAVKQLAATKTALAVARAQSVGPEQVTMLNASSIRVESVVGRLGGPVGGEIVRWTGMTTFVEAPLTASQHAALAIGATVQVLLPSGGSVEGTVASVGSAGAADGQPGTDDGRADRAGADGAGVDSAGAAEGGAATVVKPVLRVDIADQDAVAPLAGSAVTIEMSTDVVQDALIVPVTALLALAEGGYAVERVTEADDVELVGVEVGLIAEARVQVTGAGVKAGDRVRIP